MATNEQRFLVYVHLGKVFAENSEGKVIALGRLTEDERGKFGFRLNGDTVKGYGFRDLGDALANLNEKLTLSYMTDQFATETSRPVTAAMRAARRVEVVLREA